MAITVSLVLSTPTPAHGDTITATYVVNGNDGTPAEPVTVGGGVTIGGQDLDVMVVLTKPAIDPLSETYEPPTCPGLTFEPTDDPRVWTALIP